MSTPPPSWYGRPPGQPPATPYYPPAPPPPQPGYGYGAPPGYRPPGYGYGPPYKGAQYGRPQAGPGSLAGQWLRLGARILDAIILAPAAILVAVLVFAAIHPDFSKVFTVPPPGQAPTISSGFLKVEATFYLCGVLIGALSLLYHAALTATMGRSLAKRWLHIRPVRIDGQPITWGTAFGREGLAFVMGLVSVAGLLDELWCLWDEGRQCLHDKPVRTIVVHD